MRECDQPDVAALWRFRLIPGCADSYIALFLGGQDNLIISCINNVEQLQRLVGLGKPFGPVGGATAAALIKRKFQLA